MDYTAKGILFMGAGLLTLGSSVYFFIDANNKENKYLNETDPRVIGSRYNDYNSAYKIRNTLIISYIVIWIYTQIDMLLFSRNDDSIENNSTSGQYNIQFNPSFNGFSIRINF